VSKKRGPYSSPRQQDRRQRILDVAGGELEKHGLSALTMEKIAKVSEVSTKTLYNYFDSRELLLLEAASELLIDIERSDLVLDAEPGIPGLLAFKLSGIKQFGEIPENSRLLLSILVRYDSDNKEANARFGPVQRFAYKSLSIAAEKGELLAGLDLNELSYLIAANQWSLVLLWEKGLLPFERLESQVRLNHYLLLTPLCLGKRKASMEAKLNELLGGLTTATLESNQATQKE
jgi:AcrR family transcriptional regulator